MVYVKKWLRTHRAVCASVLVALGLTGLLVAVSLLGWHVKLFSEENDRLIEQLLGIKLWHPS